MKYNNLTSRSVDCPVCHCKRAHVLYSIDSRTAAQHHMLREVNEKRFVELKSHIEALWQGALCDVVCCANCQFCFASPYVAGDARFYALASERQSYPSWKWEY